MRLTQVTFLLPDADKLSDGDKGSDSLSQGAIAGIAAGLGAVVVVTVAGVIIITQRRRRGKRLSFW